MASRRRSEFLICPSRGSRSRQTSTAEGCCPEFEYRFAEEQYERLPELAVDLVGRHVAIIVASGALPVVRAAMLKTIGMVAVAASPYKQQCQR